MSQLEFLPWPRFSAHRFKAVTRKWLSHVRASSVNRFKSGMRNGPHTGRIYTRRGGRRHQASAPGEYPAVDSGGLIASLRSHQRVDEVGLGTNQRYSIYLRQGTGKMARRKMSDDALRYGINVSLGKNKGFASWKRLQRIRPL